MSRWVIFVLVAATAFPLVLAEITFFYDEAKSKALIQDIDAFHRVGRYMADEEPAEMTEDHGHFGREHPHKRASSNLDEWVVEITGGIAAAEDLAHSMGYEIIGEVLGFQDMYRLRKSKLRRVGRTVNRRLAEDLRVVWAEEQFGKRRQKRGFIDWDESDRPIRRFKRASDVYNKADQQRSIRRKREVSVGPHKSRYRFNDELWDHQWYMHDTRTQQKLPRLDLHVLPVYDMGFTGRGVTVVILDDGLEFNHTDIRKNYNADVSYDMNDDDVDPSPRKMKRGLNSHGTRCAGEIAMEANNEKCGVGVAFNAQIGGIRMLDGLVSDRVEASSLIYALDQVDIYCASWGPTDDGRTVEGPGRLTRQALQRGITQGRDGKGVIYVWAAGNGGRRGDNCNCDGYVSSIYTMSIGSVSEQGAFPWYGERCASTMAVTYSSGAYSDQKIATIDLDDKCTMDHTGTSAAAPLAAGIIALALEANPNLTWRDVQHLVVWTSEYFPLQDNFDWERNSAGFRYSSQFGFGLMNAASYVKAAANWTTVPKKSICYIAQSNGKADTPFTNQQSAFLEFDSDACRGTSSEVNYLEHVEVVITVEYPIRGFLEIELTSPSGSKTQVLQPRDKDESSMGFINWAFMSVHTWGEDAQGQWQLTVGDELTEEEDPVMSGRVVNATLVLHGTSSMPKYRENGPRIYNDDFSKLLQYKVDRESFSTMDDDEPQKDVGSDFSWRNLVGIDFSQRNWYDFL